ncbi:metalloendopeptidase [Cladophialophora chaetospira]|uniref:Metalloendopeptidase n=1 Tax=Cladophialophora chaetospira TaxID=386627 RepID=A0AA39CI15_9EURO|nr:metalloendopeptidase [Cladophialophora chaetospira]
MFSFQAGMRVAARAARQACPRTSNNPSFYSKHLPRFQSRSFASRYSRFGEKPGGGSQQQQQKQWSNFGPVYRAQYIWRNYQRPLMVVGAGGGVFYVYNLEEVPVTHRRRFNVLSPSSENEFFGGPEQYNAVLNEFRGKVLPTDHPLTVQVARVVEKLLPTTRGLGGDDWRVHVIDDPEQKNAFVMPGGKVFVFSGILPICQDENGLAAVLGHEIAHNVAHHAAERASRSSFVLLATVAVSFLFDVSGQFANSVSGLILSLPNSRTQEAEADHIGLLMMAEACYDPKAALDFWGRMKKAEQFEPPQFISTHPSNYNRAEQIKKWLPDAERIYADTGCGSTSRYLTGFKDALSTKQPGAQGQVSPQRPVVSRRKDEDDDFF